MTAISGSLLMNHAIGRIEIQADQWFAVTATSRDGTRYTVSCDEVEHGLATLRERIHSNPSSS